MSTDAMTKKMAAEYKLEVPTLSIPNGSPECVSSMFPALIKSIYDTFNGVVQKATYVEMQKQIDELTILTKQATEAMADLKVQLLQKDHLIEDQRDQISNIKSSIDRNESYSRRNNLIFGGIEGNTDGTCTEIIHNIFSSKFNITDPSNINFVRCHYLSKPSSTKKGSIIARFESFQQRMSIWSKRRCLLQSDYYISEDFPADISKKRNKLRPILKEASKHIEFEKCISLKLDKLHFNGVLYSCDSLHGLPQSIHPRTLSERRSKGMLCFGGILSEYHELSNFFLCVFKYRNISFTSVEQAYQYSKALMFGDSRSAYLILRCTSPTEIKSLGRNVTGFDSAKWNPGRKALMKKLVFEKFSQNALIKQKLCDTGTMHIAEATKSDEFFGTGVSITHPSCLQRARWTGTNVLGEILMDTRRELKRSL